MGRLERYDLESGSYGLWTFRGRTDGWTDVATDECLLKDAIQTRESKNGVIKNYKHDAFRMFFFFFWVGTYQVKKICEPGLEVKIQFTIEGSVSPTSIP